MTLIDLDRALQADVKKYGNFFMYQFPAEHSKCAVEDIDWKQLGLLIYRIRYYDEYKSKKSKLESDSEFDLTMNDFANIEKKSQLIHNLVNCCRWNEDAAENELNKQEFNKSHSEYFNT